MSGADTQAEMESDSALLISIMGVCDDPFGGGTYGVASRQWSCVHITSSATEPFIQYNHGPAGPNGPPTYYI